MPFKFLLSISIAVLMCNSCFRHKNIIVVLEGKSKWVKPRPIDTQVNAIYDTLERQMHTDPINVGPIYNKANEVRKQFRKLWIHIDSLKTLLISETGAIPWNVADTISLLDIDEKESFDIPGQIMINPLAAEDGSRGKAHELKLVIGKYRKLLVNSLANAKDSSDFKIGLLTPDVFNKPLNKQQTWEQYNFERQPLSSVLATLKRLQDDVENAEIPLFRELSQENWCVCIYIFSDRTFETRVTNDILDSMPDKHDTGKASTKRIVGRRVFGSTSKTGAYTLDSILKNLTKKEKLAWIKNALND